MAADPETSDTQGEASSEAPAGTIAEAPAAASAPAGEPGGLADGGAPSGNGQERHLEPALLYPLLHVLKGRPPAAEGPGAFPELAELVRSLPDRFRVLPPAEERLTRKDADAWTEHLRRCRPCNVLLFEDGPASKPPKTKEEIAAEEAVAEAKHREKVKQFWISLGVGSVAFIGSQVTAAIWRNKGVDDSAVTDFIEANEPIARKIDPLMFLFIILVIIASVGLAWAYTIARELWLDFTA